MTLLITMAAAVIASVVWYVRPKTDKLETGFLDLMLWGASLMWLVDAVVEYIEIRAEYFQPAIADMVSDSFLGLSVLVLALVIWMIRLFIKDPRGNWRK